MKISLPISSIERSYKIKDKILMKVNKQKQSLIKTKSIEKYLK